MLHPGGSCQGRAAQYPWAALRERSEEQGSLQNWSKRACGAATSSPARRLRSDGQACCVQFFKRYDKALRAYCSAACGVGMDLTLVIPLLCCVLGGAGHPGHRIQGVGTKLVLVRSACVLPPVHVQATCTGAAWWEHAAASALHTSYLHVPQCLQHGSESSSSILEACSPLKPSSRATCTYFCTAMSACQRVFAAACRWPPLWPCSHLLRPV